MNQVEGNRHLRGNRNNVKWFVKIHRRLIHPPYPTMIHCPNCGRPFIEVSSDLIEVDNYEGARYIDIAAKDIWCRIKHGCGAKITLYWKE